MNVGQVKCSSHLVSCAVRTALGPKPRCSGPESLRCSHLSTYRSTQRRDMSGERCWHLGGIYARSNILGLPVDTFAQSLSSQCVALRPCVRARWTPRTEHGFKGFLDGTGSLPGMKKRNNAHESPTNFSLAPWGSPQMNPEPRGHNTHTHTHTHTHACVCTEPCVTKERTGWNIKKLSSPSGLSDLRASWRP